MITELNLANFRSFDDAITVRFRPITILIGKNNVGKSSIIKFLLMLQQSARNAHGSGFLITDGDAVNLGSLKGLKNKSSKKRTLRFSLAASPHGSPKDSVYRYLSENKLPPSDKHIIQATVNYNKRNEFLGKDQKIASFAKKKKLQVCSSAITPNSVFLEFENQDSDSPLKDQCIEGIKYDLQSLRHLSAMRDELVAETKTNRSSPGKYVGKKGEDTIFELWQSGLFLKENEKEFFHKHTRSVLGIEDVHFVELGRLAGCNAKHIETGASSISIADFGFGVSQCLPIFVQGLLMPQQTHLIVEQPEAQVHPTAQIEMGSFFVDLWKKYGVGSIIETHSDNILLRIRNHISKGDISKDDISIAYIHSEGDKTKVTNLDIQENGAIQEGLPMEFFGGDLLEILRADV